MFVRFNPAMREAHILSFKPSCNVRPLTACALTIFAWIGVSAGQPAIAQTTQPTARQSAGNEIPATVGRESDSRPTGAKDLRDIIGIKTGELSRVEVPRLPAMSLRGFVQPHGRPAVALLEISDAGNATISRNYLVQIGTEIPVTVAGSVAPIGRSELSGLSGQPGTPTAPPPRAESGQEQSQIILKVIKVTAEGVIVEAGLLDRTITIR